MADETAPAPSTPAAPPAGDATATPVDKIAADAAAPLADAKGTADAKAVDDAAKAAPAIPEKYEFKGEDGNPLLTDEVVAEWTPLFKEIGLTNENAQKLAAFQLQQQADTGKQLNDALAADDVLWMEQAKSDPEIGGVNFAASLERNQAFLAKYGDAEASALLKDSRLGNHPALIRMFAKAAKDFPKNDALPGQMRNANVLPSGKSLGDRLYPNTPNQVK